MTNKPQIDEETIKTILEDWPIVFNVCQKHKEAFFSDYSKAQTDADGDCVICHSLENDALGG